MTDSDPLTPCSACGTPTQRSTMFGVAPDLLCKDCRDGVSKRLHVRYRPREVERKPVVTLVCLAACVILFILDDVIVRAGPGRPEPAWLAALHQGPQIWLGEVWRHLTCIFLHGGWFHLIMNGLALWFLGRHVEQGWGHWAMAALVLVTGLSASALQFMMVGGRGVGISGALFGLCGYLWALRRVHPIAAMVMNERMVRWIVTMLVIGVILTETGRMPIGNWAHGGGLALGYLTGLAMANPKRRLWVPLCGAFAVLLMVASVYLAFGKVHLGGSRYVPRSEQRKVWLEYNAPPASERRP